MDSSSDKSQNQYQQNNSSTGAFSVEEGAFPVYSQSQPEPQVQAPVQMQPKTQTQAADQPVQFNVQPEKPAGSSRSKMLIFILAGLIALGGIGFGAYLFLNKKAPVSTQVTITWWGLWEDSQAVESVIADYEAKNPNVKITYKKESQKDYRERLINVLAQGKGPDIFRFHNTWTMMFKNDLAAFPAEIMSLQNFSSAFYPVASRDLQNNGQVVGIPLMIDGLSLYVNDDLLSQNGLSAPTTWDQLREAAIKLTTKNEQGQISRSGVALGTASNVDHWQDILALMFLQNGVNLNEPIGPAAEDVLKYYAQFVLKDHVWDETLPPSTIAFANGKTAMYFGPSWEALTIKKENPTLRFHTVPVPQLPKISGQEPDVTWASYWAEGVSAKSAVKKQAFDFLIFMSQQPQLEKLYAQEAKTRIFGEPYPRTDMANLLSNDPLVGSYVKEAPFAWSWYLASSTQDGETGINTRISKYFEDAVNKTLKGGNPTEALTTVSQGVKQVLADYGKR